MTSEKVKNIESPLIGKDGSVYNSLLNDIASAIFVSGDRLVASALAKRYDSSINTVREAINRLQGEGLVTVSPNSGARVKKFEYRTMRDVFELLQLLEPYLIEWFVIEHNDEKIQVLYQLVEKMEALEHSDHLSYRTLDCQFHWEIYKHHYNESAVNLWRQKRLVLQIMHANLSVEASRAGKSIAEHRQIMQCLESRDIDATITILKAHITNSSQYWARYIDIFNTK